VHLFGLVKAHQTTYNKVLINVNVLKVLNLKEKNLPKFKLFIVTNFMKSSLKIYACNNPILRPI